MKRPIVFLLLSLPLFLSACNLTLAEDVTPPPNYIAPTPQPTLGPLFPSSAPDLSNGAAIYATECAPCHGAGGLGDGPLNKQLPVPVAAVGLPSVAQKASPLDWYAVVTQGRIERMMPPFSNKLSDQDRWDVVAYTVSLHTTPDMLAQGQALFEQNCSDCDTGFFSSQEKMSNLSDEDLLSLMLQGSDDFPAFGANLNEEELYATAAYLRTLTFAPAQAAAPATATPTPENIVTPEAYANPMEETDGTGIVRGSVTLSGGTLPEGLNVTLRGFDHAMDASGPQEVLTVTAAPDRNGSVVFENIELPANRILLTEAEYNGIIYQSEMYVVEEGVDEVSLTPLALYETSTDLHTLTMEQGHIFVDVSEGSVQVIEFFNVLNASQAAVIVPVTSDQMLIAEMPAGASSLGYDAQQGQASPVDAADGFAMLPSDLTYGLVAGYELPYDGSLDIELPFVLAMPAEASIFVPSGVKLEGEGLFDLGPQDIGNGTIYQAYQFGPLPAGSSLSVKVSGLPTGVGTETSDGTRQALIIGAGLLGMLLIGAGAWLFIRDRRPNEVSDEEDVDDSEFQDANSVLDAIIALDDLHRAGKIPDEAHQKRRAELKEQFKKLESKG